MIAQPGSKFFEGRNPGVWLLTNHERYSKERLRQLCRNLASQPGSSDSIIADEQRPVGVRDVRSSARRVPRLVAFYQAEPAKVFFLWSVFGKPSFRRKTSRLDIELTGRQ